MGFVEEGKRVYERLPPELIEQQRGNFIAIDPVSRTYFIADTIAEALLRAKATFPTREFYVVQIGKDVAAELRIGGR
jgi:hypothetical protein